MNDFNITPPNNDDDTEALQRMRERFTELGIDAGEKGINLSEENVGLALDTLDEIEEEIGVHKCTDLMRTLLESKRDNPVGGPRESLHIVKLDADERAAFLALSTDEQAEKAKEIGEEWLAEMGPRFSEMFLDIMKRTDGGHFGVQAIVSVAAMQTASAMGSILVSLMHEGSDPGDAEKAFDAMWETFTQQMNGGVAAIVKSTTGTDVNFEID